MDEIKQPEEVKQSNSHRRKIAAAVVFAVLAAIGAVIVYFYMQYKNTHITTDDAFIEGYVHVIASKVSGTVKTILVNDNQFVKQGDVLVELEVRDYEAKVKEASSALNAERAKLAEMAARIETAKRQLSELQARADSAKAVIELQKASLEQAESDAKRADGLFKKDAISREKYEKTMTARKVSAAQLKASQEELRSATAGVEAQKAVIRQAEAARTTQLSTIKQKEAVLETADLNYGYTKIYAPVDGYVTKKSVETGNQVQIGQPLMSVVPLSDIYITANYKETQLDKVRPGQKVDIKVDTYPGKTFKGTVDSIMAGTGAVFSLFPPENATGNYVKVVQRIPLKIVLEKNTDPGHVLRIGMSVVPTIIVK